MEFMEPVLRCLVQTDHNAIVASQTSYHEPVSGSATSTVLLNLRLQGTLATRQSIRKGRLR